VLQTERCLKRIAQVREAAEDIRSAYVYRTRLHRMLLSLQRALADELGVTARPTGHLDVIHDWPEAIQRIATLCNSILLDSRHLSQRSESLDERWRDEWFSMRGKLYQLEEELWSFAAKVPVDDHVLS
jgi:hypothetical protein